MTVGAAFLLAGMFVGRPYCRFLCPYGGLLKLASLASKWRVRVTPDTCTQCRLCEQSCPFGAMREPAPAGPPGWAGRGAKPPRLAAGPAAGAGRRRRVGRFQAQPGGGAAPSAVALAERYVRQQTASGGVRPDDAGGAFARSAPAENPEAILKAAADLRHRFDLAVPVVWRLDRTGHRRQVGRAVGASGADGLRAGPRRVFRLRPLLHRLPQ